MSDRKQSRRQFFGAAGVTAAMVSALAHDRMPTALSEARLAAQHCRLMATVWQNDKAMVVKSTSSRRYSQPLNQPEYRLRRWNQNRRCIKLWSVSLITLPPERYLLANSG